MNRYQLNNGNGIATGSDKIYDLLIHQESIYFFGTTTSSALNGSTLGGTQDLFVLKLDDNLVYQDVKQFGRDIFDTATTDNQGKITLDQSGKIIITGTTDGLLIDEYSGGNDFFVYKFDF